MGHTTLAYHYSSLPSLEDYNYLENILTLEERQKMNDVVNSIAGPIRHSSYENKLLSEKMAKMGYLFQYMIPMNFMECPPTDPPKK